MIEKLKDPMVRKYIYSVATALIPMLVIAGVMVPGWSEITLTLVAALLGLGTTTLAGANTPKTLKEQEEQVRLDEHELTPVESQHEAGDFTDEADRIPEGR